MVADGTRAARRIVFAAALAGVVLGALVLRADGVLAEVGRQGGAMVARHVARGERVWCDGGWGFQWYAMKAGARPLAREAPWAAPGDVVVASDHGTILDEYPYRERLERWSASAPGGRVMDARANAGFYSNGWGYLPWAYSRDEAGHVEAWRILPRPN
jgi:hypothetical protein